MPKSITQTRRTRSPERAEARARLQARRTHRPAHSPAEHPAQRQSFRRGSSNSCPRRPACPAAQSACRRSLQGHPAPRSARPAPRREFPSGCQCKRFSRLQAALLPPVRFLFRTPFRRTKRKKVPSFDSFFSRLGHGQLAACRFGQRAEQVAVIHILDEQAVLRAGIGRGQRAGGHELE